MCIVLGILILALLAYIVYLYASYYRIEDNQELVVEAPVDDTTTGAAAVLATDTEYSAVTYNIGFGAYLPDYSFFMDGGTSSWAESPETVQYAINGAGELVKSLDPDFALIQEIDLDATRSYHTDEYEMLRNILPEYTTVFAQNYDSAFLFYPFTQPHGSSRAGLGLFSKYPVSSALRRSFPISTSFSKFFDLDRCYSVSRIPVDNGKELVIFNLHMSAYGNSDEIRKGQTEMLCNDMAKEYEAGNYVLCGGDFNHGAFCFLPGSVKYRGAGSALEQCQERRYGICPRCNLYCDTGRIHYLRQYRVPVLRECKHRLFLLRP